MDCFPERTDRAGERRRAHAARRDGSVLPVAAPVWNANGRTSIALRHEAVQGPFRIDGSRHASAAVPRAIWCTLLPETSSRSTAAQRRFAAVSDAVLCDGPITTAVRWRLWQLAREFTLADHFFMGTFGGSFMNTCGLRVAALRSIRTRRCAHEPARPQGRLLRRAASPPSALAGPVSVGADGAITPDGYAINTTQPPYQPSGIAPAPAGDPQLADPSRKRCHRRKRRRSVTA